MPLYRVEVEERRTWILWVDAEDEAQACADAEELAGDYPDADFYETESYAHTTRNPDIQDTEDVWVGGDAGEFIPYDEYRERVRRS
jgi:hypothetical protein